MSLLRRNPLIKIIRNYSKTCDNYVEVKIPVPWGHVAGKWWGSRTTRPILVLHGYQDNCGSFDRLLPELIERNSFLAIDLPGQGHSTHLPKGMFYNFFSGPLLIKQISEYFQWSKVSLLGHSMGGMMCFAYASYLPQYVDFLICLDGVLPLVLPNYTARNGKMIEKYMKYSKLIDSGTEPPSYTIEELENKLHEGTKKSIDIDKCKYILERVIAPSKIHPGKYYFTMDQRLKAGPHFVGNPVAFSDDINRVTCPTLITIPDGSPFYNKDLKKYSEKYLNQFMEKQNTEVYSIKGTHHVHLNEPELVTKLIKPFLAKYDDIGDRTVGGIQNELISNL